MKKSIIAVLSVFFLIPLIWAEEDKIVVGIVESCPTGSFVKVGKSYVASVEAAGFVPIVLPLVKRQSVIEEFIDAIDILLLTGGEDVAPERYGSEPSKHLGKVNLQRDSFEWQLLEKAKSKKLPIFGICRGMQIINIFFGGTLYQDIPAELEVKEGEEKIVHRQPKGKRAAHKVNVLPATRLASIVGKGEILVNTYHHQSVKKIAPGFVASAIAPDGVIEAFEASFYPAAGVQFHPEKIVYDDDKYFETARIGEIIARLPELAGKEPMRSGTAVMADILESTDDETLLKAFIAIPSVTPDKHGCNRATEAMAAHLRRHGLKCTLEVNSEGRKVLFACSRDTKKPDILISAHLDTVSPQSPSMYNATVTNGVLYGRGASDCKGHCVLAARLLRELKDDVSIGCIFGPDEEGGGLSTKWMVDEKGYGAEKVIFVLDMEPYSITTKQKGLAAYKVKYSTAAMHTGLMKGKLPKNALDYILEGREKLGKLIPDFEDGSWRNTARIVSIKANTTKAETTVFASNAKDDDWSSIESAIEQAFPGAEISNTRKSPAVILDESDPVLNEFLRRTRKMCEEKGFKYDGYYHLNSSTDARHFRNMGKPMIITGTDCHGGHTSKEHMILSSMQDYFELISKFILDCYKEKK